MHPSVTFRIIYIKESNELILSVWDGETLIDSKYYPKDTVELQHMISIFVMNLPL